MASNGKSNNFQEIMLRQRLRCQAAEVWENEVAASQADASWSAAAVKTQAGKDRTVFESSPQRKVADASHCEPLAEVGCPQIAVTSKPFVEKERVSGSAAPPRPSPQKRKAEAIDPYFQREADDRGNIENRRPRMDSAAQPPQMVAMEEIAVKFVDAHEDREEQESLREEQDTEEDEDDKDEDDEDDDDEEVVGGASAKDDDEDEEDQKLVAASEAAIAELRGGSAKRSAAVMEADLGPPLKKRRRASDDERRGTALTEVFGMLQSFVSRASASCRRRSKDQLASAPSPIVDDYVD